MSYTPKSIGHVVMRVRDLDRSLDFYTRVMGLTIMERTPGGTVFMSANTEKSHELAIRAIGMDAAGPDSSLVGQAHMAWQWRVSRTCKSCTCASRRMMPGSCASAITASPWAYT